MPVLVDSKTSVNPENNPYRPPQADRDEAGSPGSITEQNGGIGRLAFAVILPCVVLFVHLLGMWIASTGGTLSFTPRAWIFLVVIAVVGVIPRIRNIGMHTAKVIVTFIPIANLVLALRCLAYQGGYEKARKLDKTGKIIAASIAVLAVSGYVFIFVSDM